MFKRLKSEIQVIKEKDPAMRTRNILIPIQLKVLYLYLIIILYHSVIILDILLV